MQELTTPEVAAVALGRRIDLPGNAQLRLVEQSTSRFIFHDFHYRVTGMSRVRLNSYWARQVFTGESEAPRRVQNDEAVIAAVQADPTLLGYVSALPPGQSRVRVVLRLEGDHKSSLQP